MVVAALVLGLVGAVLAIAFQWLAVGLGGFAAGVHGTLAAAPALGLEGSWLWAVAFAAGILLAALVLWLWDPVLIVLSALTGAALLAPLVPVSSAVRPWLFIGLLIVGIVVQARVLAHRPATGRRAAGGPEALAPSSLVPGRSVPSWRPVRGGPPREPVTTRGSAPCRE